MQNITRWLKPFQLFTLVIENEKKRSHTDEKLLETKERQDIGKTTVVKPCIIDRAIT